MTMNPVDEMTVEQLRDEVEHWRSDCAARLATWRALGPGIADGTFKIDDSQFRVSFLMPSRAALANALAGDYHQQCEACGKPLRQGQLVFSGHESNDIHADCLGVPTSTEGFVDADGEPLPTGAPIPTPFPYDTGFDAARIERELALTNEFLADPEA